jgi:hypothetical protein
MIDVEQGSIDRHKMFLARVIEFETVWGLRSEAGWCVSTSNEDPDLKAMPFWSDRAYAARCARGDWADYKATAITLDEFLDAWLPGMAKENVLVGTNWNVHLVGKESDPEALLDELLDRLQTEP